MMPRPHGSTESALWSLVSPRTSSKILFQHLTKYKKYYDFVSRKCTNADTIRKSEDLADPQTKLTPHQIHDVQRSWENIRGDRNAMISSIFVKYDFAWHLKFNQKNVVLLFIYLFRSTGSSRSLPAPRSTSPSSPELPSMP